MQIALYDLEVPEIVIHSSPICVYLFYQLIGLLGLGGSGTLIARGSSEFMIINTILAAESLILLIMSVFLLIGTWKVSIDRSLLFGVENAPFDTHFQYKYVL